MLRMHLWTRTLLSYLSGCECLLLYLCDMRVKIDNVILNEFLINAVKSKMSYYKFMVPTNIISLSKYKLHFLAIHPWKRSMTYIDIFCFNVIEIYNHETWIGTVLLFFLRIVNEHDLCKFLIAYILRFFACTPNINITPYLARQKLLPKKSNYYFMIALTI